MKQQRTTQKAFSELISHHIVLKKQFRNDKVKIAGKAVGCKRLHGLKLKPLDECDTDDEDLGGDC